jgi:hypothetical protein
MVLKMVAIVKPPSFPKISGKHPETCSSTIILPNLSIVLPGLLLSENNDEPHTDSPLVILNSKTPQPTKEKQTIDGPFHSARLHKKKMVLPESQDPELMK